MRVPKPNKFDILKNNFCNSLREVNCFLCRVNKINTGKKLINQYKNNNGHK